MGWLGLVGPPNMPQEIVARLDQALRQIAADSDLQKSVLPQGLAVSFASADELRRSIQADLKSYGRIKDSAHIVVE
jgi:tripartite-type tricarboxylate transporter receptor subunit TctC